MPQYPKMTVPKSIKENTTWQEHLSLSNPTRFYCDSTPNLLHCQYTQFMWLWHDNIYDIIYDVIITQKNIEYILSFRETTSYIITVGFLQYSHSMISSFYQYWIMLEFNMIYKNPIKLYYMMPTNLDRNDLVTKKSLYCKIGSLLTVHKVQFWTKSDEKPLYLLFDQRHKAFSTTPISGKVTYSGIRKGSL